MVKVKASTLMPILSTKFMDKNICQ